MSVDQFSLRLGTFSGQKEARTIMGRRYSKLFAALLWAAFWVFLPERSWALSEQEDKSDLALVLAVDASGSIDQTEFMLQLRGIASAFRRPEIVGAIRSGPFGKIDVALLVWAGQAAHSQTTGWVRIADEFEAERFAAQIESFPRRVSGGTGVSNAIMTALALLGETSEKATRQCIDLSGDGRETTGRGIPRLTAPSFARAAAENRQVTINALAIETEEKDLARWYHRTVVTSDGFVMAIGHIEAFADAIRRKLIKEIRGPAVADIPAGVMLPSHSSNSALDEAGVPQ